MIQMGKRWFFRSVASEYTEEDHGIIRRKVLMFMRDLPMTKGKDFSMTCLKTAQDRINLSCPQEEMTFLSR